MPNIKTIMNTLDLHIHSKYSCDGQYEIGEILQMGADCGLKTIAITDHNSVKGVAEALVGGERHGIEVIPGIEIDCTFDGIDLHLLGCHIDAADSRFEELEEDVFRQDRTVPACGWKSSLRMPENRRSEFLIPYHSGGARSDSPVHFHWDHFAQGKVAYVEQSVAFHFMRPFVESTKQ